jgi:hypothetical protein
MKSINGFSIQRILLLVVGLGLLAGCSGVPTDQQVSESVSAHEHDSAASAILRIMKRDDEIVAEIQPELSWDTARYIRYIVTAMKNNESGDCPEEFSTAYSDHIKAWQNLLRTVMDHHAEFPTLDEYGRLAALHGTSARSDLERELFAALDEVKKTFEVCVKIAKAHGISKSEYDIDK